MLGIILLMSIGFLILVAGADFLIRGASNIAKKLHISDIIIGLTIVALGTSMPELTIAISSAKKGITDLIIGDVIGANIYNLLLILGIIAILKPINLEKKVKIIHLPVAYVFTLFMLIMGLGLFGSIPGVINNGDGMLLILMFFIYFVGLIFIEIKDSSKIKKQNNINNKSKAKIIPSIIYVIIGIIFLKIGGDLVVDKASELAVIFGLSERIIGLTIVALGTTLPEMITSMVAVIKNNEELAVGNLVGSCILNSGLILGIAACITPIPYSISFNKNLVLLAASILFIWLSCFIGEKNTITRKKACVLVLMFMFHIRELFL